MAQPLVFGGGTVGMGTWCLSLLDPQASGKMDKAERGAGLGEARGEFPFQPHHFLPVVSSRDSLRLFRVNMRVTPASQGS